FKKQLFEELLIGYKYQYSGLLDRLLLWAISERRKTVSKATNLIGIKNRLTIIIRTKIEHSG
ncbi:MAG: hypothetical protein U9R42_12850, partial [Bacteroidota bacterium]|nr:hypothetical protein [Bacteroidota bacterium]